MYLIRENPVCPSCGGKTYMTRNGGGGFFRCRKHPLCKGTISAMGAYKAQVRADKAKAHELTALQHQEDVTLAVQAIKRMRNANNNG